MELKSSLVRFSYSLAASKRYKEIKSVAREILEDSRSPLKRYFDIAMILLVLVTIIIFILEIKHDLPDIIYAIEGVAVTIFILEWLARLWVSSDVHLLVIDRFEFAEMTNSKFSVLGTLKEIVTTKLHFIFSPMSIIDLLAILPSYRPLRFLRFFLLFRLFKLFRYTQDMNFLMKVFVEKRFEFLTLFILFAFLVFFASTVIYVFEGTGSNEKVNNFYDAIYWAVVTITTVGYGDITPQTSEGRFATILLIVSGLGIIAFTTSIVTTAMTEKLELIKENNILNQASKLKNFVLICGFGKMGRVFADELSRTGESFVIIDNEPQAINLAAEKGFLALRGDAGDSELLQSLNVEKNIKYVLAMSNDDATNLSILLAVKSLNDQIDVIARANHANSRKKFKIAGAKRVLFPYETAAIAAIEYLAQPLAYEAMDTIIQDDYGPIADEIEIVLADQNSITLEKSVLKKFGLKLLGIVKKGDKNAFMFNPSDERLALFDQDILIVVGYMDDIARYKKSLLKVIDAR